MSIDLTVIVPIYNGMPHLAETIDSILVQRRPRFELLLINDGSSDEGRTKSYLDSLIDSRVRVIHKDNEGLCLTLNLGFREARGSYVARIDQDDLCALTGLRFNIPTSRVTVRSTSCFRTLISSATSKCGTTWIK